jgi:hypothetical protein
MIRELTLPAESVGMLAGRHEAALIAERTAAAFWLYGRDDATALFLLHEVHAEFAKLADALGYDITPKATEQEQAA